jgi:pimeloyl-ACP methyl ester carboxylesterase
MAYEEYGSGPPLLLLHGFSLDHSMWRAQAEELQRSYRLIVPDLRGLGKSQDPSEPFTIEVMADDAATLMEAVDVSAAAVAGFSLGGYILLRMLARHPLKVRAAAFVSTHALADSPKRQADRLKTMRFVIDEGTQPFANAFIPQLFEPAYLSSHPQEVTETRRVIESQRPNSIALLLDAMRQRADMSIELRDFQVPSAVIGGVSDALVSLDAMKSLHEGLPDCSLTMIENVGHMAPVEAPGEVSFQLDQLMQRAGMWM